MSATMTTAATDHGHEAHGEHHAHHPFQAHHFDTMVQQFDSAKLGIWLFLITEVMFFSGLFVAYILFRVNYPEIFAYGHQFLDKTWGMVNTIVLLFSSLTMAWAVRCAQLGQQRGLITNLIITIACAAAFLGIKYIEYSHKIHEGLLPGALFSYDPNAHHGEGAGHDSHDSEHSTHVTGPMPARIGLFFSIYFCITGLHGIHIIAGMIAISWILYRSIKGHFGPEYFGPVDYVGLYWHLVDLIWIYLFPLLYLIH